MCADGLSFGHDPQIFGVDIQAYALARKAVPFALEGTGSACSTVPSRRYLIMMLRDSPLPQKVLRIGILSCNARHRMKFTRANSQRKSTKHVASEIDAPTLFRSQLVAAQLVAARRPGSEE